MCSFKSYAQFNYKNLPEIQLGLSPINYYSGPVFANALLIESRGWRDKTTNTTICTSSGQLDSNGYPLYLNAGQTLIAQPGQNGGATNSTLFNGKVCLTWEGDADIRLTNCGNPTEGSISGSIVNGRRVYNCTTNNGYSIEIFTINPANYPKKIRIWMPDPSNPMNKSLEPLAGQSEFFFHPTYLQRIGQSAFSIYRMMDWGVTNASPLVDWADRRPENHCFQAGIINTRNAPGNSSSGPMRCGVSFETMAKLANQQNRDIYIHCHLCFYIIRC